MKRTAGTAALAVLLALTGAAQACAEASHHKNRPPRLLRAIPSPGTAPVQMMTLVNDAGIASSELELAEAAITLQSFAVRMHWNTPIVEWGAGGWPVTLSTGPLCDSTCRGYHSSAAPAPFATTQGGAIDNYWTVALDHEVIETLVDPSATANLDGLREEPCDPVNDLSYQGRGGVWLSDFVYPNWFAGGSAGPWDAENATTAALDLSWGEI